MADDAQKLLERKLFYWLGRKIVRGATIGTVVNT